MVPHKYTDIITEITPGHRVSLEIFVIFIRNIVIYIFQYNNGLLASNLCHSNKYTSFSG